MKISSRTRLDILKVEGDTWQSLKDLFVLLYMKSTADHVAGSHSSQAPDLEWHAMLHRDIKLIRNFGTRSRIDMRKMYVVEAPHFWIILEQ